MLRPLFTTSEGQALPWVAVACALLLLVGLAVRIVGLDYNLPAVRGHDERAFEIQVAHFREGAAAPRGKEWVIDAYPHLLPRAAALLPDPTPTLGAEASLEEHRAAASAAWVQLRRLSAWLGWLLVPLTYLLARRWLEPMASLFACGLIATSMLCVTLSVQAKPHAAAGSLLLLSLLCTLSFAAAPSLPRALGMGVAGALAAGTLHSAWISLPPIVLASALALRAQHARSAAAGIRWSRLAAASLPFVACLWIAYPFFLPGVEAAAEYTPRGTGLTGFLGFFEDGFRGANFGGLFGGVWALDPLLVLLGALGLGVLVWDFQRAWLREPAALLIGAFALPSAAVLALHEGTLVRFLLPFAALAALAAGYAFQRLVLLPGRAPALVLGLVLALSAIPAVQFAWIRTQKDPLTECAEWIEAHVPREETIVFVPYGDIPLPYERGSALENAGATERSLWSEWQLRQAIEDPAHPQRPIRIEPGTRPESRLQLLSDPRAYLESVGARWVVIDLSGGGSELFRDCAERVARFSSRRSDDGVDRGLSLAGTGWDRLRPGALRVLEMQSLGTSVEIWRLR
jgi:hypothetical protein